MEVDAPMNDYAAKLRIALPILLGVWALPALGAAQVAPARGDGECPAGQRLLTYDEAMAQGDQVCRTLGPWYIARLADGGSMDGPGYGCEVRRSDDRSLGHSVCTTRALVRPRVPVARLHRRQVVGTFAGVHPHWRDTVTIRANGTYARGNGDPGRWHIEGQTLVLDWARWGAERLELQPDGSFRAASNGFTLTPTRVRRPRPPRYR